ncbi:MFS transporter [Lactiplantibacillus paraxiangfangensis]|uniref:MFS transporter n=2 Tax=Lactiplantibacillus paraxiangfangensis TaxID=3076224 RepID=UPI0030C677C8
MKRWVNNKMDKDIATSKKLTNQGPYIASMTITFFCFYGFSYLVSWMMIKETGSPELLSKVLTITMLPAIALNLIAGRVVKALSAKVVMAVTDLLTGILFIFTYGLMELSVQMVTLLIVVSVLNKSIGVFYKLSNKTIIPELFVDNEIKQINSIQTQVRQLSIITSSILVTGLLVVLNPKFIIFIIGLLFIISVVFDLKLQRKRAIRSDICKIQDGHAIHLEKGLKYNLLLAAIGCFVDALVAVLVPWLSLVVLKNNWLLSLLLTFEAVGILLAPIILSKLPGTKLSVLSLLLPVSLLLLYPYIPSMMVGMLLLGLIRGMFNVQFFSKVQREVAIGQMSATMAKVLAVTDASTVVGTLGAAWLANIFGSGVLVIVGIVLEVVIVIGFVFRRRFQNI